MEKKGEGEGEGGEGEGEGEGQGRRDHRESSTHTPEMLYSVNRLHRELSTLVDKPITRFDLRPVVKEKEKEKAEKKKAEKEEEERTKKFLAAGDALFGKKGEGEGEEEEELVNETVVTITVTTVNRGTGFEPQTDINAKTNTRKFKRPRTAPEQEGYEVEFKRPRPAP